MKPEYSVPTTLRWESLDDADTSSATTTTVVEHVWRIEVGWDSCVLLLIVLLVGGGIALAGIALSH